MGSVTNTNIHLLKTEDQPFDKFLTKTTQNVVFAHKLRVGETGIDLSNLNNPSAEMPGFVQPNLTSLASLNLFKNKNNLTVFSLSKGKLTQFADYVVVGNMRIEFTSYFKTKMEVDEVFECLVVASPTGEFAPSTTKSVKKTYTLVAGQTTLPLDFDYPVNSNSGNNVGQITVYRGTTLLYRNTNNSSTTLDKDYYEPDSGNGYASTLKFNTAQGTDVTIFVDFGVRAIVQSDLNSQVEYLTSALMAMATDLAVLTSKTLADYFVSSPTEIQRREFGNTVNELMVKPETNISALDVDWSKNTIFNKSISSSSTFTFSNTKQGKTIIFRVTNTSGSNLTLTWPATVKGADTTVTANKERVFTFIMIGTTIYASSVEF